ncbi:MAG: hypothetical protein KAJ39_02070 [Gammaproteobacteria bacterium]|nr:hypothetical protein [Gammaproteobacteria bacterium]
MESQINWDMIKAITGIMSIAMTVMGAVIVLLTRWIFITKKEFHNKDGETLFLLRAEYKKDMADRKERCAIEHTKLQIELEKIKGVLVPRPEWIDSKTGRERRTSKNIEIISGEIQKVYEAIDNMRKENSIINKALNNLTGSFKTFLELEKKSK